MYLLADHIYMYVYVIYLLDYFRSICLISYCQTCIYSQTISFSSIYLMELSEQSPINVYLGFALFNFTNRFLATRSYLHYYTQEICFSLPLKPDLVLNTPPTQTSNTLYILMSYVNKQEPRPDCKANSKNLNAKVNQNVDRRMDRWTDIINP